MAISVGIPTFNEEKVISNCIHSVLKQISKNDEIIVVASGCTDKTSEIVLEITKKDKRVKLIIEKERKGKTSALNLIKQNARNEIIVQTDGDVILEKKAVIELIKHFKDKKVGAVSGQPVPVLPKTNVFHEWTLMSYRKAHELRLMQNKEGTFWHLSGYLCAYRKNLMPELPQVKGAVDAWMGKLIQEKGCKLVYEPKAKVLVKAPLNARDFVKQKARVRAGFYFLSKNLKKQPRKIKSEIFYFPKELLSIKITRWPAFIFSAFVYLYAWFKGWYFYKTNASLSQIWKHVTSSKS